MSGITYIAAPRAPLVTDSPAHAVGTSYDMDIKLRAFSENIDTPKSAHVSLGGNVETVLSRATKILSITLIWDDTLNAQMEEFLFSIAGGETFSFDPYGTIASPDNAIDVVCMNKAFPIGRVSHGSTPWRSVSLSLRRLT